MRQSFKLLIILACITPLILVSILTGCASTEKEVTAADFYKGKTIEWYVQSKAGGGFDTVTRLFAPYIEKHTGAKVVVINKPGGGMMLAPIHVCTATEPDGLSMSTAIPFVTAMAQLLGAAGMENVDATTWNWLASIRMGGLVLFINPKLPYKSLAELRAAKGLKLVAPGPTVESAVFYRMVMGEALGMEGVSTILGYESMGEQILSVVRGETDGAMLPTGRIVKYVEEGEVRPILLLAEERHKLLPDVPTIHEALTGITLGEEGKFWVDIMGSMSDTFGSVVTAPGVPQDRVEFLREAFKKCYQEQELWEKGDKAKLDISTISGEDVAKMITQFVKMSPEKQARFKKLIES